MTIQIPVGYMQVQMLWSALGDPDPYISTIGAQTIVPADTTLDAIVDSWASHWPATDVFSQYTFLGAKAQVGQGSGPPAIIEAPRVVPGAFTGNPLPSNCAMLMRKVTALGGRKGRGRMYWPPIIYSETAFDHNGMMDPSARSDMNLALAGWIADFTPVLLHNDATPPTTITALVCEGQLATQRRRMR